jgi:iron complex transport system permease protein
MNRRKLKISYLILGFVLLTSILVAASIGSASLSPVESLKIILSRIPILKHLVSMEGIKTNYETIVWSIRIPRILLAGLSGASLALVGACFQGVFRNPLADPQLIGVSSGAALGATIAVLSGINLSFLGLHAIGIFAFLGAILTVLIVYQISSYGNRAPVVFIILTGVAISSILTAVISFLMSIRREQLEKIYMWTLGSFSGATMTKVLFLFVFLAVCGIIILFFTKDLDLFLTGEDTARSLGVDTAKVRKLLIVIASVLVAACVSVCGTIGFVGLIIPHAVRLLCGPKHSRLMPLATLSGAIFLILCDTMARTVRAPGELPVGVVTSLCGGPYFIFLLMRAKKKGGVI